MPFSSLTPSTGRKTNSSGHGSFRSGTAEHYPALRYIRQRQGKRPAAGANKIARLAGGQDYEVQYAAKKTCRSAAAVKKGGQFGR
jgi:hypothetical protein